jgi:hypothetical protein
MRVMIKRRLRGDLHGKAPLGGLAARIDDPKKSSSQAGRIGPDPWRDGHRVISGYRFHLEALPGRWCGPSQVDHQWDCSRICDQTSFQHPCPRPPSPGISPASVTCAALCRRGPGALADGLDSACTQRGLELWDIAWVDSGGRRAILYKCISLRGDGGLRRWF